MYIYNMEIEKSQIIQEGSYMKMPILNALQCNYLMNLMYLQRIAEDMYNRQDILYVP